MLLGNLRQAQPGAAGLNDLLTIAHRAWEKESPQHVNDAPGLTLATERAWTEDMKSIYTDPVVIRFVRQRMNPGDDPFPTPR